MTSREVLKKFLAEGWQVVHIRGSHRQLKHPKKSSRVTLPHPKKDLPKGTLRSIFKQEAWSWPLEKTKKR
ncbi:MAG: type II toxin-antitoxin system HicA family toxin [Deltaproteobacteria bacterium]|nr:type II toxin-antitoxin system HicA family toxin [Deltaproteobacteria bacterium]